MARRVRLRLLGDGWHAFGAETVPEDRVVEVSEVEVAAFLRGRSGARHVEILGWVKDKDEDAAPHEISD